MGHNVCHLAKILPTAGLLAPFSFKIADWIASTFFHELSQLVIATAL